jgi:hypothetical protein
MLRTAITDVFDPSAFIRVIRGDFAASSFPRISRMGADFSKRDEGVASP